MIKISAPLLASLAKSLYKPLLGLSKAEINPLTAKLVGSTIGGVSGGMVGANAAPEGSKAKGFLIGAGVGATGGYLGGKTVAGFGQHLGVAGVDSARISGLANELKTLSTSTTNKGVLKGIGNHIGTNWADPTHLQDISKTTVDGPSHRAMLSPTSRAPIAKVPEAQGSGFTSAIGNLSRNAMGIADGSFGVKGTNMASRTWDVLKREANEMRYYTKTNDATKETFKYKRSLAGQALGVGLGSGIGMGAFDGYSATNNDGTPASLTKKITKGTTSALSWGLAAPVMGAKAIAYDIPKMFINPEG